MLTKDKSLHVVHSPKSASFRREPAHCTRCNALETAKHIFFECPFAIKIWELIPLFKVVHIATEADFKDIIVAYRKSICLPPSGITGAILPWIC